MGKVIGKTDHVASAADVEVAGSAAYRGGVLHLLTHAQELRTHEFDLYGRPRDKVSGG